jgi:hypothetical protein
LAIDPNFNIFVFKVFLSSIYSSFFDLTIP